MSNVESMKAIAVKSYLGFEEGSYAARKGRQCLIKKIHFEMHPPSVTVQMLDTDTEVGTEFDRLQHLSSWFCDMCTAQNTDVQAKKCSFCKMDRNFKEKITIIDSSDDKATSSKPVQPVEQAPDINNAEQETSDTDTDTDDVDADEAAQETKVAEDEEEYEELPKSPVNGSDHEISAEDEPVEADAEHEQEYEYEAKPEPKPAAYEQERHPNGYWPSYQPMMGRVRPQRHGVGAAVANEHSHGHGQRTQNRSKRQHTDFMPPPPVGQRRSASNSNRRTRSHPQPQPNRSWMYDHDDDMMQFRRPLHSYWPRSWYDWDW